MSSGSILPISEFARFPSSSEVPSANNHLDSGYVLHTSAQSPHRLRSQLAQGVLHEAENRIRVIVKDVGRCVRTEGRAVPRRGAGVVGGEESRPPVKWTPDRSESFLSDHHARDQTAQV